MPRRAALNDRTTVAMGFAMAQFFQRGRLAGANPGLRNAAAMAANLVKPGSGRLSPVLHRFPNGGSTSALATFNSLANLVASCRRQGQQCARLLLLGQVPGRGTGDDTLGVVSTIARNPWHNAGALFALSRRVPKVYGPVLSGGERPDAWTLALRFEGAPRTMNGPGNFAIDSTGSLWVVNNYGYTRNPRGGPCAGEQLLRFTPTGRAYPGSPYEGGGLNGAGFGIGFDPRGRLWAGNFGFAARGCDRTPPSNSVSLFTPSGRVLSPSTGFTTGEISWPQGTVADRDGNIWIANCGNDSVTRYPNGLPRLDSNLGGNGLRRPFDVAIGRRGLAFVTGNGNSTVAVFNSDGSPAGPALAGYGLDRPMGVATDSRGYAWIANSGKVIVPCDGGGITLGEGPERGTLTLLAPDGTPVRERPFPGAGMTTPWGVAVDGSDSVWVANFSGRRLSQLCGTRRRGCPPGKQRLGASIAPAKTGYGFDGLTRNTGVAVDPSGNVWLTNNWKLKAVQTNPGGYQIVAFLGLAAPIRTPLIGTPESP